MKSTFFAFSLLIASTGIVRADGANVVVDYAEKALAKGYGTTCSLSMIPNTADGYYPCLDFGPYRYVREYQKISAYVVGPDKKPFQVMGGTRSEPKFSIGGPWEQDMAARMVAFWNDVVEGGAKKAEGVKQTTKERQDAEAYIRKMMGGDEAAKSPPPQNAQLAAPTPSNSPTMTTEQVINSRKSGNAEPLNVDETDIKEIMKKSNN
jgi:hypothetical protein